MSLTAPPIARCFNGLQGKAGETVSRPRCQRWRCNTAAVQFARAAGFDRHRHRRHSPKGAELAKQSGAHFVFDHTKPDYLADIMMATHGHGVDIILEMLANVNLGKDLTVVAMNGRIIVIGSRGKVEIDARDAMKRDIDIRGMMLANSSQKEKAAIHAGILAGLENGTLNPVIGQQFPLAEAAKAHEAVLKSGAYGKNHFTAMIWPFGNEKFNSTCRTGGSSCNVFAAPEEIR